MAPWPKAMRKCGGVRNVILKAQDRKNLEVHTVNREKNCHNFSSAFHMLFFSFQTALLTRYRPPDDDTGVFQVRNALNFPLSQR